MRLCSPRAQRVQCILRKKNKMSELNKTILVIATLFIALPGVTCTVYRQENSDLREIPDDIPDATTEVHLRGNDITTLPAFVFSHLSLCTLLDIEENSVSEIENEGFYGLSNLQYLDLGLNKLTELKAYMFQDLTELENLEVHYNKISTIEDNTFAGLSRISWIHLGGNALTELRASIFHGLRNLKSLGLDDNALDSLDSSIFADLPRPFTISLSFNPTKCDSKLCWLKKEEKQKTITWIMWNGQTLKPDCVDGIVWDTWQCPGDHTSESTTPSDSIADRQPEEISDQETQEDNLVLVLGIVGAFIVGLITCVVIVVGVICWKRRRLVNSSKPETNSAQKNGPENPEVPSSTQADNYQHLVYSPDIITDPVQTTGAHTNPHPSSYVESDYVDITN